MKKIVVGLEFDVYLATLNARHDVNFKFVILWKNRTYFANFSDLELNDFF